MAPMQKDMQFPGPASYQPVGETTEPTERKQPCLYQERWDPMQVGQAWPGSSRQPPFKEALDTGTLKCPTP